MSEPSNGYEPPSMESHPMPPAQVDHLAGESVPHGAEATISELDRIDVLAMVLQGRDGDHPSEFWRSRAHRLLNHREPLLAVLGLVEVEGAETCTTHIDGVLLDAGPGVCDMSDDLKECVGAPLYRAQVTR